MKRNEKHILLLRFARYCHVATVVKSVRARPAPTNRQSGSGWLAQPPAPFVVYYVSTWMDSLHLTPTTFFCPPTISCPLSLFHPHLLSHFIFLPDLLFTSSLVILLLCLSNCISDYFTSFSFVCRSICYLVCQRPLFRIFYQWIFKWK